MIYKIITIGNRIKPSYKHWMVPGKRIILGKLQTMYVSFIREGDSYIPMAVLEGTINARMVMESEMLDLTGVMDVLIIPRAIESSNDNKPVRLLVEIQSLKNQKMSAN